MVKLRIAICDDDLNVHKMLINYIEEVYGSLDLHIDSYYSGEEYVKYLHTSNKKHDILFLDIEMDKISGLQVAKYVQETGLETFVIFATSHDELAPLGYEFCAFRFLVKPIIKAKLIQAIEAAKNEIFSNKSFVVKNKDGDFIIKLKDILYIEAQNQDVIITLNNEKIVHRENIKVYEDKLKKDDFFRTHRSYLVNMKHVKGLLKNEIMLDTSVCLPISRLRVKEFKEIFHEYIKKTSV